MTTHKNCDTILINKIEYVKKVPSYRKLQITGYKISISPNGIRKVIPILPYLNGTFVNLTLNVKKLSGESEELSYEWRLLRWDGQKQNEVDKKGGKLNCILGNNNEKFDIPFLATPGEHTLLLRLSKMGQTMINWEVITTFGILERDKSVMNIVIPILTVLIGAGGTLFIQWLLKILG